MATFARRVRRLGRPDMYSVKLKAWRVRNQLSLEAAAREIGCSASHLWRLEHGADIRTVATAKKVAGILGLSDYRKVLS
jgi:transcriptional regulator with XRE-family HTH domain